MTRGWNFAPLYSALDGIQQQRNQNRMFDAQQQRFEAEQQHRNRMFDLQKQKMAAGDKQQRPWWAGADGSVDPAMQKYRQMGRPTTNVNVNSKFESAYDKELGQQYAKTLIEGKQGARQASRDLNNLRVMEKVIQDPNLYTGTGAGTIHGLKKAASSLFGVPIKGVEAGEVVSNLSKTIAVGLKSNLPGPLSDSDRRFLVEMAPGLQNTPEGNRQIIALGMLQKQYMIDRAKAANDYANGPGKGRIDGGFDKYLDGVEAKYAEKFSNLIQTLRSQGAQPNRTPAAGVNLDGLRSLYGMEK